MRLLNYKDVEPSVLDVRYKDQDGIWNWGNDNAFPSSTEAIIDASPTASACVAKVAKAIYGGGFGDSGKLIVNKSGQSLNEVLRLLAKEYTKYGNGFLHVGYNGELKINSLRVLSAKDIRIGKSDDMNYAGKFVQYDNWDRSVERKIDKKEWKYVDRFNPKEAVVRAQIEAAGGISQYKGQILHLSKDSLLWYALPDLFPALRDAELEARSQQFRSRGATTGFLNTRLLVVKPFSTEEERNEFKKTLKNLQGSENSGDVLVLESATATGNLQEDIKLEDLSSQFDDELFQYSDTQAKKNIALALGVPLGLVDMTDSGLFGSSGELLKSMMNILRESREEERLQIEETINGIMTHWHDGSISNLQIL